MWTMKLSWCVAYFIVTGERRAAPMKDRSHDMVMADLLLQMPTPSEGEARADDACAGRAQLNIVIL
ncbi:hypothetical protein FQU58_16070 [Klebsiella pneumoniae]|nr:hypothetical protein FQU58_16070 [Klebsiella pneumoniae]